MKISDIRDPKLFQRLVHRLFVADRGVDFQVVDDSGGDGGNDGYDAARGILYAIYCPEKPESADYRRKAVSDFDKAVVLASKPGYHISSWVFVTPTPLREPLQAELRALGEANSLTVAFLADTHLEDLFRQYPHLRDEFPELEYPNVAVQLEEIRKLIERQPAVAGDTSAAQTPIESPRPSTPPGVLAGMVSPRLMKIFQAIERHDLGAAMDLERYRMEALDVRDALDALLLSLDVEGERNNFARALHLAETGLQRARSASLNGEIAVFASNVAYYKTLELVQLEIEHESNLHSSQVAGFPFNTVEQIEIAQRPLLKRHAEIEELLQEARKSALESNNLLAIHVVMVRQGAILTHQHWPLSLRVQAGNDTSARTQIDRLKGQMEQSYEAAIKAARAMNDEARLATAYGNLANDLRSFGDVDRAREHAKHALQLAQRSGYKIQVEKTSLLLDKLGPPPQPAA
jgi:tetratricopeptide (TPR) repeat protein